MRILIQRVKECSVTIEGERYSSIGPGMLIFVGITHDDTEEDIAWLAGKASRLRIFDDSEGVMNRSVIESGGEIMVVSQFTLQGSTRKGNRPSYIHAAGPDIAIPLYERFIKVLGAESGCKIATGRFGADMQVSLINDGPVTIWIDSKNKE